MSFQRESDSVLGLLRFLTLGKSDDLRTILTQALKLGISVSDSQAGVIWLYDGRSLKQASFFNVPDYDWLLNQASFVSSLAYDRLSLGKGLTGTCFVRQEPVISDDLVYDELTVMTPRDARKGRLRACVAVPIGFDKLTVGVMTLFRSTTRSYEPHTVHNLCLYGTEIALCLHHCICFPSLMVEWERVLSEYDAGHEKGQLAGQETGLAGQEEKPATGEPSGHAAEEAVGWTEEQAVGQADSQIIGQAAGQAQKQLTGRVTGQEIGLETRQEGKQAVGKDVGLGPASSGRLFFPKGIQLGTLGIVQECFDNPGKPLSCNEVAEITGLSTVTARRYLNYMVKANILCQRLQYGDIGRPAFVYFARK